MPETALSKAHDGREGIVDKAAPHETALKATWGQIQAGIQARIGEAAFAHWLKNTHLIALDATVIELGVPTRFHADWIAERFGAHITQAVAAITGHQPELKLSISGYLFRKVREQQAAVRAAADAAAPETPRQKRRRERSGRHNQIFRLKDRFRLDTFVVGACNRLASTGARRVVTRPGVDNPFIIWGASGTGKTHLLQGIAQGLLEAPGKRRVLYVSCEYFVNQFMLALREKRIDAFREKFRQQHVLLIDDIHGLARKNASQNEFLYTYDYLIGHGAQIVLATDVLPTAIPKMAEPLINRFAGGMIVKVKGPDAETRHTILAQRLGRYEGRIPAATLAYLAERPVASFRELEGDINKLVLALAALEGGELTPRLAAELLDDLAGYSNRQLDLAEIENVVIAEYGIASEQIHSRTRRRDVAHARQVCMYLARELTDFSLNEIGRFYGDKNHATVVFARKKVLEKLQADAELAAVVARLKQALLDRPATPTTPAKTRVSRSG